MNGRAEPTLPWSLIKQLHVALALLTACSFCLRGYWMLARSPRLDSLWSRRLPHVVDALLLLTGVSLAVGLSISPHAHPWLAIKLLAVVAYVIIGSIALKRGRSYRQRVVALLVSLMMLAYIFGVALHHDPWVGAWVGLG
jgi:uncharacterized membrane protein SirB2